MVATAVGSPLSTTSWEKASVVTVVVGVAKGSLESPPAWTMVAFPTLGMVLALIISTPNPQHLLAQAHA
jgi:hypothetical protein